MSRDEQQPRGGFVPVGDLAIDLPIGLVPARRERAPQTLHYFTQLDQVTQLVDASEADAISAPPRGAGAEPPLAGPNRGAGRRGFEGGVRQANWCQCSR